MTGGAYLFHRTIPFLLYLPMTGLKPTCSASQTAKMEYIRTVNTTNLRESDVRTGFRSFKRGFCGVSRGIKNCAVSAVLGFLCACSGSLGWSASGGAGFPENYQRGLLRA
jgi:hypothetical protein